MQSIVEDCLPEDVLIKKIFDEFSFFTLEELQMLSAVTDYILTYICFLENICYAR